MMRPAALESGPCLICQRPGSPLRRPYGWLCDEHNNTDDANGTCVLYVCDGSGVVLTRDGVQACVCRVGRALAAATVSDLFGDLLAAQQAAEQAALGMPQ